MVALVILKKKDCIGDSLEKCNATSKILCDWISDDGVAFYFGIEVKSGAGPRGQAL